MSIDWCPVFSLSSAIGAVVAYCIIGGVYMYRVKGARGSEVIPNVAFWKELPLLIKVNTYSVHVLLLQ